MEKNSAINNDVKGATSVFEAVFGWGEYIKKLIPLLPSESVITLNENNKPVGCALVIETNSPYGKGGYLYGVGVLPKYRLRGYMRILLDEAEKLCKNRGYKYISLVPQEEYLFAVYQKLGYTAKIYKNAYVYHEKDGKKAGEEDRERIYELYKASTEESFVYPREIFELHIKDCELYLTENGYRIYREDELFESYGNYDAVSGQKLLGLYKPLSDMPQKVLVNGIYID